MRRSHLLQARRYEDILRSRPRVRARLRRPWPVSVLVLEQSLSPVITITLFTRGRFKISFEQRVASYLSETGAKNRFRDGTVVI